MRKVIILLVLAAIVISVIVSKPPDTQVSYPLQDGQMPRSHSIFSMETGDMEYLYFLERQKTQ